MKIIRIWLPITILFALILSGCSKTNDESQNIDASVSKTLSDNAIAMSAFPRTLDTGSVLHIYDPNVKLIENGEFLSLDLMRNFLKSIKENVDLGRNVGISSAISDVKVMKISSTDVIATYNSETKLAFGGNVNSYTTGLCSAHLKKHKEEWLIDYQHCFVREQKD